MGKIYFLGFDPTLELTCQDGVLKIKADLRLPKSDPSDGIYKKNHQRQ